MAEDGRLFSTYGHAIGALPVAVVPQLDES